MLRPWPSVVAHSCPPVEPAGQRQMGAHVSCQLSGSVDDHLLHQHLPDLQWMEFGASGFQHMGFDDL